MGEWGGPRHFHGQGLGQVGSWTCPTCGTGHTTRFEDGCAVCLAEDAKRAQAVVTTVTGVDKLEPLVLLDRTMEYTTACLVRGEMFSEPARQSLAAALAHFVEHGAPDAHLLPKAVMIGWARELAGLGEDQ